MPPSQRYSPLRPHLTRSRWRSFASARSKPWPIKAHADGIPVHLSPWRRSTYNPPGVAWTGAVLRAHPPFEGGGVTNGAFLRAGLIDEISLAIFPAVDGAKGAPCVFDAGKEAEAAAPLRGMTLASSEVLESGAVWLRYRVQSG